MEISLRFGLFFALTKWTLRHYFCILFFPHTLCRVLCCFFLLAMLFFFSFCSSFFNITVDVERLFAYSSLIHRLLLSRHSSHMLQWDWMITTALNKMQKKTLAHTHTQRKRRGKKPVKTIWFNPQFRGSASFVSLFNLIVCSLEVSFCMNVLSYLTSILMLFFRVPLNLTIFLATYGGFDFVLIAHENGVITEESTKTEKKKQPNRRHLNWYIYKSA